MKKYIACGVLHSPRQRIPVHRVLGVFEKLEEAEDIINMPDARFFMEYYIQETDDEVGLIVVMTKKAEDDLYVRVRPESNVEI